MPIPASLRPVAFNEQVGELICDMIAAGDALCKIFNSPGFPTSRVFERWCQEDSDFAANVELALTAKATHLAEEGLEIADNPQGDWVTVIRKDGREEVVFQHENVQRSRLRVETRKWFAAKLGRKRWGESKDINIDARVVTVTMTDAELDRRLAQASDNLARIGKPLIINNSDDG
jgi:hypothetical protein